MQWICFWSCGHFYRTSLFPGIAIVNEAAEQSELDLEEEQMQLADTGEYHINDAEQMDPSADESLNSDGVPKKAGTVKL